MFVKGDKLVCINDKNPRSHLIPYLKYMVTEGKIYTFRGYCECGKTNCNAIYLEEYENGDNPFHAPYEVEVGYNKDRFRKLIGDANGG